MLRAVSLLLAADASQPDLLESTRETNGFTRGRVPLSACVDWIGYTFRATALFMCIDGSDTWPSGRSLRLVAKAGAISDQWT